MALTGKIEFQVEMKTAPDQFYQIFKSQTSQIPNMSADKIHAIRVQKGDGKSQGSVKEWDYTLDGQDLSLKETIEVADDVNKILRFKVLDGDITKHYKSFKATVQAVPKGSGSSVKVTLEYEKRSQDIPDPVFYQAFATKVFKDIDEHLKAQHN